MMTKMPPGVRIAGVLLALHQCAWFAAGGPLNLWFFATTMLLGLVVAWDLILWRRQRNAKMVLGVLDTVEVGESYGGNRRTEQSLKSGG